MLLVHREQEKAHQFRAAHTVLSIPTILSDIFDYIAADDGIWYCRVHSMDDAEYNCKECKWHHSEGALLDCMLVNQYWFSEAVRILWRTLPPNLYLSDLMRNITPNRRQIYTDWVTSVTEAPNFDSRGMGVQMEMPRLKRLSCGLNMPDIKGDKVEELELEMGEDYYPENIYMFPEDMEVLFDTIAASFPNVKRIYIWDKCLVYARTLEKLSERLPHLEEFDTRMIEQVEKDDPRLSPDA